MRSDFIELNLYVYHSLVNAFLDAVIWCLGPYVDDARNYGLTRHLLARLTRKICGLWLGLRDAFRGAENEG